MNKNKIYYFDYLRVVSAFMVIVIHVSAFYWYDLSVQSNSWIILNTFNALTRASVPIFVMISGALFLSKDNSIKKLWLKNILRLAIVFIVWDIVYAFSNCFINEVFTRRSIKDIIKYILKNTVHYKYHLWFVPMLIGVYAVIPVLKLVVNNENVLKYFLRIFFIFAILINPVFDIANSSVGSSITFIEMPMIFNYCGYFVLGYYLHTYQLTNKQKKILYALGIMSFVLSPIVANGLSIMLDTKIFTQTNFSIFVFFQAVFIFELFKNMKFNKDSKIINSMSKCSLGIYLLHILVMEVLFKYMSIDILHDTIIMVPIVSIIIFMTSYLVCYILKKVPLFNKWII